MAVCVSGCAATVAMRHLCLSWLAFYPAVNWDPDSRLLRCNNNNNSTTTKSYSSQLKRLRLQLSLRRIRVQFWCGAGYSNPTGKNTEYRNSSNVHAAWPWCGAGTGAGRETRLPPPLPFVSPRPRVPPQSPQRSAPCSTRKASRWRDKANTFYSRRWKQLEVTRGMRKPSRDIGLTTLHGPISPRYFCATKPLEVTSCLTCKPCAP